MRVLPILALVLGVAACGSSPKRPDPRPPAPGSGSSTPVPAEADAAPPATCEDACTAYAGCYEDTYGKDYHGGGECVTACEELAEADRAKYIADWTASGADCATLMGP